MRYAGPFVTALFAGLFSGGSGAALGPVIQGVQATAYSRDDSLEVPGSCGYGAINQTSWPFGALFSVRSNDSLVEKLPFNGCGSCFTLTCAADKDCRKNSLPVTGLIVDSCATCTSSVNLIALPITRFVSLSNIPGSIVNVTAQQVDCAPPGNIVVRILNNPNINLMLEVVLLNVMGSGIIRAVALKNSQQDDSAWVPMEIYNGAIWQAANLPPVPFDLRVTNEDGQIVVMRGFYNGGPGGDFRSDVQFPPSASTIGSPMPSAPAPPPAQPPAGASLPQALPPLEANPPAAAPPAFLALPPTPLGSPPALKLPNCPGDTSNLHVVEASVANNQPCRTLLSILQSSSSLSKWLKLLQARGLADALSNPSQQLTMFAPIDSAFSCNVFQGSNSLAATIDQIADSTQNSVAAIVGGQVVPGYFPSGRLQPGIMLNTTDQVQDSGQTTCITVEVAPASVNGPIQIQGIGSVAKILQADVEACGPSVLHVTDSFILPFAPTPTDSVKGGPGPVAHSAEGPPSITVHFP